MSKWAVNQEVRRIALARSAGRLAALETRPKPALPSVGKSGLSLRREHKLLTSGARGGIEPPALRFSVQRIAATRDARWVRATGIFGRPDLRASRDSRLRLSLPHAARRRNGAGSALGPRNSSSRWLKFYSPTPQSPVWSARQVGRTCCFSTPYFRGSASGLPPPEREYSLFQYRSGSNKRRMVIGRWGEAGLTAKKARRRAEPLRGATRERRDPVAE
jgi:hypothetical protein